MRIDLWKLPDGTFYSLRSAPIPPREPEDKLGSIVLAVVMPLLIVLWILWPSDSVSPVNLIPRSVRYPQVIEKPQYSPAVIRRLSKPVYYVSDNKALSDARAEDLAEAGILSDSRVEDLAEDLGYLK